jgi:hypothetical protein
MHRWPTRPYLNWKLIQATYHSSITFVTGFIHKFIH